MRREGYVPDIDLGVDADASSKQAVSPDMEPVVMYPEDEHGVTVSAVLVQHAPVFPALGYRFDTPTGSVAFSGDTGACPNIGRLARGADVLVHEILDVGPMTERIMRLPNGEQVLNHLASSHSSAEQVATHATAAGVREVVLSHLVPGDFEFSNDEWESRVRAIYDGDGALRRRPRRVLAAALTFRVGSAPAAHRVAALERPGSPSGRASAACRAGR